MSLPEYEALKPCPMCGNTSPWTYISFSCAVLECDCGVKMKDGAVQVMYEKSKLPDELKPFTYEATGLVIRSNDGTEKEWPEHGYIGVSVLAAFKQAGVTERWNRRTATATGTPA